MKDRDDVTTGESDVLRSALITAESSNRDRRYGLVGAFVAAVFALLAALLTGFATYRTSIVASENEFHANLVLRMLEAEDEDDRRDGLQFLLDTGLLSDSETAQTLEAYLRENPEGPLPQVGPKGGVVVPRTPQTAGFTDFTVYVCEPRWATVEGDAQADRIVTALSDAEGVGQVSKRLWDFYDEVPLADLQGRITIVADFEHPEFAEVPRIAERLETAGLPTPQTVDNSGADTPWLVSIITCPA